MTEQSPETTNVNVELPAKTDVDVEVAATPETVGNTGPDAATETMEQEPASQQGDEAQEQAATESKND